MKKGCKRLYTAILTFAMICGFSSTVFAESDKDTEEQFASTYEEIMSYAEESGIDLTMTYDDFVNGYDTQQYDNVSEYADAFYETLQPEVKLYSTYSAFSSN